MHFTQFCRIAKALSVVIEMITLYTAADRRQLAMNYHISK